MTAALLLGCLLSSSASAFDRVAAQGLKDWKVYCAACHGGDGRGRRDLEKLRDLREGALDLTGRGLEGWPDESLKAAIDRMVEKRPGLKEAHALSSGTVAGLIAYLRIVGAGQAVDVSSAAWASIKDPGERGYLKACGPCHGRSGAGVFDSGWGAPEEGVVDLRPPLPKRKVRTAHAINPEWIAVDGGLSDEEAAGLVRYLDTLEARERARTLDGKRRGR